MKRAVVLLSGGMDSAVTLAIARNEGFDCSAVSVRYGQTHAIESRFAAEQARKLGAFEHIVADLNLSCFASVALTGGEVIPKGRTDIDRSLGVAPTYVPARNTVLLGLALARAEAIKAQAIYVGFNAEDRAGYPDCRPAFVSAFQDLTAQATAIGRIRVVAPLIELDKAAIIRSGIELGVDFAQTSSCYDPGPIGALACGGCDACLLRLRGFADAGLPDPIQYRGVPIP